MITFKELGSYGRLGNQIFQAAATIALAVRNNDKFIFPHWDSAKYFNLGNCFTDKKNISKIPEYQEPFFHYQAIPYQSNLNLIGYYQSEKYFYDCQDLIRYLFKSSISLPNLDDMVALHVRRTDYLTLTGCFANLEMEYYSKALELLKPKKVLIFSDDIAWCKTKFTDDRFSFSEDNSPIIDLFLMSKCGHQIIANSSYSWWAAWLNSNTNKKIVAPKTWFGPKLAPTHDTKDLIPDEWIRI